MSGHGWSSLTPEDGEEQRNVENNISDASTIPMGQGIWPR